MKQFGSWLAGAVGFLKWARLFFAFCVCWCNVGGIALCSAESLHHEIAKLEGLKKVNKLSVEQRLRLAEIYLLTSRCGEALELLADYPKEKTPYGLVCACRGYCPPDQFASKFDRLKGYMARGFYNPKAQKLWSELKVYPQAKYIMIQSTQKDRSSKIRKLARELQKQLESLEVQ